MRGDDSDIGRMVRAGLPDADVLDYRPVAPGKSQVCYVEVRDGDEERTVVLKTYPESKRDRKRGIIEKEVELYRLLDAEADFPVPEVYAAETGRDADPRPYFLMERLPGGNYERREDELPTAVVEEVVEAVGAYLAATHEITFDRFGFLRGTGDGDLGFETGYDDWRTAFGDLVLGWVRQFEDTRFAPLRADVRGYVEANLDYLDGPFEPRLVHFDSRIGNLLVDPRADDPVTGVLDWETARAGHAEFDLAKAEFMFVDRTYDDPEVTERLRERLYEGYRARRDLPRDEGFERRRDLYHVAALSSLLFAFPYVYGDRDEATRERLAARFRRTLGSILG